MNNVENVFCRLCAELKPHNKLFDLQTDDKKFTEIFAKLSRFNVQENLGDNVLPKMVCDSCITSLNCAFDFVTVLEKAQSKLNDFILKQQTKQEQNVSKDELVDNYPSSSKESDVTNQNTQVKSDTNGESTAEPLKHKNNRKKNTNTKVASLTQMKLTWKSYKWHCTLCGNKFPTIDEIRTHSMKTHNICNPFHCIECKVRKVSLDRFVQHVKQHKPYLRMSCYICSKVFKSVIATNKHIKEMHTTSDFVCNGCNMSFESYEDLDEHTLSYKRGSKIGMWIKLK